MTVRSNLSSFLKILSSYNSNVLLAAFVFLLFVVLFVLLLHFYARFFWSHSHQAYSAARRRRTVTTTRIIPAVPLGGGSSGGGGGISAASTTSDDKGLDSWVISSIPLFVYKYKEKEEQEDEEEEEECAICLGLWEEGDVGRKLRNCEHGFHMECIDMWFSSHSTCPLCRSPVLTASAIKGLVEEEVRLQLEEEEENVGAMSSPVAAMEENSKTRVDEGGDRDREGEVRIQVFDEEMNSRGSRSNNRRSTSSSSLMRMLSSRSRSECNKVSPSATQDSSSS